MKKDRGKCKKKAGGAGFCLCERKKVKGVGGVFFFFLEDEKEKRAGANRKRKQEDRFFVCADKGAPEQREFRA